MERVSPRSLEENIFANQSPRKSFGQGIREANWFGMRSLTIARQVLQRHWKGQPRRALRIWAEHGWKGLWARIIDAFGHHRPIDQFYANWIELYDTLTESTRRRMHAEMAGWAGGPPISLLMPVANHDLERVRAAVASVRN
jgi:hypothetical protein